MDDVAELFTAIHVPTGQMFTRDGRPIVSTREQWAKLGSTVGELTPMPADMWPWAPLFEGYNDQTPPK